MAEIMRIVDAQSGLETSRAELDADGTVRYIGPLDGATPRGVVRTYRNVKGGFDKVSEADAIRALMREGWSNGYLMVDLSHLDQPQQQAA